MIIIALHFYTHILYSSFSILFFFCLHRRDVINVEDSNDSSDSDNLLAKGYVKNSAVILDFHTKLRRQDKNDST